jgi:hypothetical protein
VLAVVLDVTLMGRVPPAATAAGIALMVAAGVTLTLDARRDDRKLRVARGLAQSLSE